MCDANRNLGVWAVGTGILAILTTGCMVSPQHGEHIGHISKPILCAGATLDPGQVIEVQARDPAGQWVTILKTVTGQNPYVDENGEWCYWLTSGLRIPAEFWMPALDPNAPGQYQAELRAIVPGNAYLENGLFTFEDGWTLVDPPSNIYGTIVTIYGDECN